MVCFAIGVSAASWSMAAVLAVVNVVDGGVFHLVAPWLLIALAIGVTSTLCVVIERSREQALRIIHAEFEGEVTERHLNAV